MDFCYVWLRRLVSQTWPEFINPSTRNSRELTGNETMGRGLTHFTSGLSSVFRKMAKALKPGSPLVFTYHHNNISAYYPIAVAILDSGLTCSASLPCPAEMGASIHINGTGSSIIDTVFVCRSKGVICGHWPISSAAGLARLVKADLAKLKSGKVNPTPGDIRCIAYGHLIRLAVWSLRKEWDRKAGTSERISRVAHWLNNFGGWPEVEKFLRDDSSRPEARETLVVQECAEIYGDEYAVFPF
jgi:putative DNA methylase